MRVTTTVVLTARSLAASEPAPNAAGLFPAATTVDYGFGTADTDSDSDSAYDAFGFYCAPVKGQRG